MTDNQLAPSKPQDKRPAPNRFMVYKRQQAAISRGLLYPVTAFYTCYSIIMLVVGWRSAHPRVAVVFYLAGIPVWTLVEYLSHRYILHGRYKPGKSLHRRLLVKFVNPLHWEHHERPFDGEHINGELKDLLPLFAVAAPLSFIFPTYTAPMLLAGVVLSYVLEEWVHHCVHFYNFRNSYFKYIRKHHIYHHTSPGMKKGYGLTNGFWDIIFKTRFPVHVRQRLYGRGKHSDISGRDSEPERLNATTRTFQS